MLDIFELPVFPLQSTYGGHLNVSKLLLLFRTNKSQWYNNLKLLIAQDWQLKLHHKAPFPLPHRNK